MRTLLFLFLFVLTANIVYASQDKEPMVDIKKDEVYISSNYLIQSSTSLIEFYIDVPENDLDKEGDDLTVTWERSDDLLNWSVMAQAKFFGGKRKKLLDSEGNLRNPNERPGALISISRDMWVRLKVVPTANTKIGVEIDR